MSIFFFRYRKILNKNDVLLIKKLLRKITRREQNRKYRKYRCRNCCKRNFDDLVALLASDLFTRKIKYGVAEKSSNPIL